MLARRRLLEAFAALPGAGLLGGAAPPPAPGLHAHAATHGRFYGCAVDTDWLQGDRPMMAHVATECRMLTSENSFKWLELRPGPGRFTYGRPERLMAFAAQHRMQVRGHTLAWHLSNPDWLVQAVTSDSAEALLTAHIREVVGHFRGRVVQWDVVNEPIQPDDDQPGGFRDTLWYRALGPGYIDLAFHACAAADPAALRVLNDYGVEAAVPWQDRRRGPILALLSGLRARNVPIQAFGIQAHLSADEPIDQTLLARFCDDVTGLGLQLVVTEMDVDDRALPADIALRDAAVAAHGRAFLDVMLARPAMLGVVTWGLSDRYTRQNQASPRRDGLPHRPLPLDADLQRKPLWTAMAGSFDAAVARAG